MLLRRLTTVTRSSLKCLKFSSESSSKSKSFYTKGPVSMFGLGVAGLVCGGLLFYYDIEKEKKILASQQTVKTVGKAALGGPWVLVDMNGVPRTDASYLGQYTLLYFGFTYCPDICPSELVKVGKVMTELEKRNFNKLKPLFISVDPSRDSIGQLRNYSQDFHPSIEYLTGTKDQIAAASRAYRVYFSKANEVEVDGEEDYLVDHSIVLYLVGPDGEFIDFFTQRLQVGEIVDRIIAHAKVFDESSAASHKK